MSETKLIPLDLKALIFNNSLFGSSRRRAFGMAETTVVPLELAEVRKTQRRVAALLNLPFTGNCICVKRGHQFSSDVCYLCHRFNSHRHLGGDRGKNRKCPHLPPVPQNSFLGLEDKIDDSNGLKANVFDTSIFKEGPDPLGFKLPPVFSKDIGKQKEDQQENGEAEPRERRKNRKKKKKPPDRIVPTISERTFVNSNLRSEHFYDDNDYYDEDESYDGNLQFDDQEPDPSYGEYPTSKMQLPKIPSGNLVTLGSGSDDDVAHRPDADIYMTSRSEPALERTMSGDREKTAASLHIDEDYVPMSVFIKPKSDTDDSEPGVKYQYDDDLSTSISGSLGVSRETSLGESENSIGDRDDWCRCLDPLIDEVPCQECGLPQGHESWCARKHEMNGNSEREVTLTCLLCGRPLRPLKSKKKNRPEHRKHTRSQDRKDSKHHLTPEMPVAKSKDQIHDRSTCSGKKKIATHRKTSRASLDQHVRFDDFVEKVSPDNNRILPRTALEYEKGDSSHSPLFQTRHPVSKPVTHIPNLGVNVHKAAYTMALTDARATGAYKKQGKRSKVRVGSERPTGTVFSYFPLLKPKRPLSEGEKVVVDLGIKQDEGRKVAPKSYMKHIFGNIKMADYYPGGKKWRQVE